MAVSKVTLSDRYLAIPSDSEGIFRSRGICRFLDQLEQALKDKIPTVLVTGMPGIGKTAAVGEICRLWASREELEIVFLAERQPEGMQGEMSPAVIEACRQAAQSPKGQVLLIIDDAQSISAAERQSVLQAKAARLDDGKATTVVFVHGFDAVAELKGSQLRNMRKIRLTGLERDEIGDYLRHRLFISGHPGITDRLPFDREAIDLLFDLSQGVPRFVNHFAERALHEASREGRPTVNGDLLRACLLDAAQVDIGWPSAEPAPRRQPLLSSADKPEPAGDGMGRDPVRLRADQSLAILPPQRRRGRRRLMQSAMLALCLAGVAGLLVLRYPILATSSQAVVQPVQPVRPSAKPSRIVAEPVVIHEAPPGPALGPPAGVGADPDPAQLLGAGLRDELTDPANAAIAYEGAALAGNGRAAYYLGQLFETGSGVPRDVRRAQAWYSVAIGIAGAEARLAALGDVQTAGEGPAAAPVPLRHTLFRSGRTALHWRNQPGQSPQRYIVEYVAAGQADRIRQMQTTLSAALLKGPVIRWRVVGLDDQGRRTQATAWSSLVPPPR